MSLRLGRLGRAVLWYIGNDRAVNGDMDRFGRVARMVLGKRYTPGLTRETYRLAQKVSNGQRIEIRSDGFFTDGQKLAENPLAEYFPNPAFLTLKKYTPERLAKFARFVVRQSNAIFPLYGENPTFEEIGYNRHVLPRLLEKSSSLRELKKWNKEVLELLHEYNEHFTEPQSYIALSLPSLLDRVRTLKELKKAIEFICNDQEHTRDQLAYIQFVSVTVPKLIGCPEPF